MFIEKTLTFFIYFIYEWVSLSDSQKRVSIVKISTKKSDSSKKVKCSPFLHRKKEKNNPGQSKYATRCQCGLKTW